MDVISKLNGRGSQEVERRWMLDVGRWVDVECIFYLSYFFTKIPLKQENNVVKHKDPRFELISKMVGHHWRWLNIIGDGWISLQMMVDMVGEWVSEWVSK